MATSQKLVTLPLDPSLYILKEDEIAFFKTQTGIQDNVELRDHILQVQAEAYAVYPYPCIRIFEFACFSISRLPAYEAILKLGKEKPGAIFLDLGCCLGTDARKLIADGFPRENVITTNLEPEFWELGHKLFKTSQETYPVPCLVGDIFDPLFFSPSSNKSSSRSSPPPLATVTSLTPLQNHLSIIYATQIFHLFTEPEQRELANLLAMLLSPLTGSMIIGAHFGLPDIDQNKAGGMRWTGRGTQLFAHSATSWKEMWTGQDGVFKPDEVILYTDTEEAERKSIAQTGGDPAFRSYMLSWSVTRA